MTMLVDSSAIVADLVSGGEAPEIKYMIGVGVVKESEAVLFYYIGNDEQPIPLMTKAGKPLTRLSNVNLVDIAVVTGIGTENATKLNVILEIDNGSKILITSGIQTWWTTCVIAGLFGLLQNGLITTPFNLDSYRGNLGRKPIFASIRSGQVYSDQELYAILKSDRTNKAWDSYELNVSTIVETLKKELNTTVEPDTAVEAVDVQVEEKVGGDF
tara:strand:+ start:201 stop:842 length:642 start_codon:yes stop_codon:yes gene_type:complete